MAVAGESEGFRLFVESRRGLLGEGDDEPDWEDEWEDLTLVQQALPPTRMCCFACADSHLMSCMRWFAFADLHLLIRICRFAFDEAQFVWMQNAA